MGKVRKGKGGHAVLSRCSAWPSLVRRPPCQDLRAPGEYPEQTLWTRAGRQHPRQWRAPKGPAPACALRMACASVMKVVFQVGVERRSNSTNGVGTDNFSLSLCYIHTKISSRWSGAECSSFPLQVGGRDSLCPHWLFPQTSVKGL